MNSISKDIEHAQTLIDNLEAYVNKGIWHPDKNLQAAKEITEADHLIHQLMDGHTMKIDLLSPDQIKIISNLLKKLTTFKDRLPNPPWK